MELKAKAPLENTKACKGKYICYVLILTSNVIARHGDECDYVNILD